MERKLKMPKVILVDDEEYILEFMKSDLEEQGIEVIDFTCPEKATSFIKESLSQGDSVQNLFLVTDYRMPNINGLEMIEGLQDKDGIIFENSVLLTGLISPDDLARASEIEGLEILEKPVEMDILLAKIKASSHEAPPVSAVEGSSLISD
ncbi:MAG: hypothetical protein CME60_13670 [Halobacteriovoraceae bacterium]|nr:hypothetical protein [Halobacteriovoraceae bacterium]